MSMHRSVTGAAVLAVALLGAGALAVGADGQDPAPTLTLLGGPAARRDVTQIDARPRGESVGDRTLAAETVRRDGRAVGRALIDCVAADATFRGQACTVTLLTRAGQLTAQGAAEDRPLPGRGGDPGTAEVFAITGATGSFPATGALRVRSTSRGDTFTVTGQG